MISESKDGSKSINIIIFCLHYFIITSNCSPWNLYGKPGDGYYIAVKIGFPSQQFNLLVDTGSSNLAIAGESYPGLESYYDPAKSSTFKYNGTSVKVSYTQGWWEGYMGQDFVHISSLNYLQHTLSDLSIITKTHGFYVNDSHWQGILGLAYSEIAKPKGYATSFFDSLSEELPNITNDRFDLQLCGPRNYANKKKHLGKFSIGSFGSVCNKSKFSTIIRHRWYYEVIITGFKIGDVDIDVPCSDFNAPKTIIDSGTSNLQLSSKSYYRVISELRRKTELHFHFSQEFWDGKEEICFSNSDEEWSLFPTLSIFLNHDEKSHFGIKIPPQSYLRPVLNRTDQDCWLLGIEMAQIGTVLGTVALEGFCLVFDRKEGTIYFSETTCGPPVSLIAIRNKTDDEMCDYAIHVVNGPLIASSVILTLVLLPLAIAFVRWVWSEFLKPKSELTVPFISLDETNT